MHRPVSLAAPFAALLFAVAIVAHGAMFPVFSHLEHPVGLLGATAVPRAWWFNAVAFVGPGILCALGAIALRNRLGDAGWAARIGSQAVLLSTFAFAAQGLLPLDSTDLDGGASRLHAAAWTAWWLAFCVGAVLLQSGRRSAAPRMHARAIAACAAVVLAFATLAPLALPPGLCQRIAFAAWFTGMWFAARRQP